MNEDFNKVLTAIFNVLLEKNKRYGNAALCPSNIFYEGTASNSIAIRLDDKISRVRNSNILRKNDMFDILGYLILYSISLGYFNCSKEIDLENNLEEIRREFKYFDQNENSRWSTFVKGRDYLHEIDSVINFIRYNKTTENVMCELIYLFVMYFVASGITDFNDLID